MSCRLRCGKGDLLCFLLLAKVAFLCFYYNNKNKNKRQEKKQKLPLRGTGGPLKNKKFFALRAKVAFLKSCGQRLKTKIKRGGSKRHLLIILSFAPAPLRGSTASCSYFYEYFFYGLLPRRGRGIAPPLA
jgi:hypothetical protein